jgi:retron-type reverse transcriptase
MHGGLFNKIISLENLFTSWYEFRRGKRSKYDVALYEQKIEANLFSLHGELKNKTYRHSEYSAFYITDPKLRLVHKAKVRDRIVHHAIYHVLYPIFDSSFICDSYSCRIDKGTHKAVDRLNTFIRKTSKNYTGACFVLKCDIKKFFSSVDHRILTTILERKIDDPDVLALLQEIIISFGSKTNYHPQLQLFDFRVENRERERELQPSAALG